MSRKHLFAGLALLAFGGIGAAHAGETGFLSHSWGITAAPAPASTDDPSWRGYTGRRQLATETPWAGTEASLPGNAGDPSFHRARPLDPQNPWGEGVVAPSVPALVRGRVEANPF